MLSSYKVFRLFMKFTSKKLLLIQELESLKDCDKRISQKVENVPKNLRITSTQWEINNAEGVER